MGSFPNGASAPAHSTSIKSDLPPEEIIIRLGKRKVETVRYEILSRHLGLGSLSCLAGEQRHLAKVLLITLVFSGQIEPGFDGLVCRADPPQLLVPIGLTRGTLYNAIKVLSVAGILTVHAAGFVNTKKGERRKGTYYKIPIPDDPNSEDGRRRMLKNGIGDQCLFGFVAQEMSAPSDAQADDVQESSAPSDTRGIGLSEMSAPSDAQADDVQESSAPSDTRGIGLSEMSAPSDAQADDVQESSAPSDTRGIGLSEMSAPSDAQADDVQESSAPSDTRGIGLSEMSAPSDAQADDVQESSAPSDTRGIGLSEMSAPSDARIDFSAPSDASSAPSDAQIDFDSPHDDMNVMNDHHDDDESGGPEEESQRVAAALAVVEFGDGPLDPGGQRRLLTFATTTMQRIIEAKNAVEDDIKKGKASDPKAKFYAYVQRGVMRKLKAKSTPRLPSEAQRQEHKQKAELRQMRIAVECLSPDERLRKMKRLADVDGKFIFAGMWKYHIEKQTPPNLLDERFIRAIHSGLPIAPDREVTNVGV